MDTQATYRHAERGRHGEHSWAESEALVARAWGRRVAAVWRALTIRWAMAQEGVLSRYLKAHGLSSREREDLLRRYEDAASSDRPPSPGSCAR